MTALEVSQVWDQLAWWFLAGMAIFLIAGSVIEKRVGRRPRNRFRR